MIATRTFMLIPVFLGLGIGLYFALPVEPPSSMMIGAGVMALTMCLLGWAASLSQGVIGRISLVFLLIGLIAIGFGRAQWRSMEVSAPMLQDLNSADFKGERSVSGRIREIEPHQRGMRIILDEVTIEQMIPEMTPERVRIRFMVRDTLLGPGDRIRFEAMLYPPSRPVMPYGFDLARHLYFQRIGAVGYSLQLPRIINEPGEAQASQQAQWQLWTEQWRTTKADAVSHVLRPREAGVALALLLGERGGLFTDDYARMQFAGLAHILAISGLHMVLVAGFVFFVSRRLLASSSALALHYDLKKIAAIIALIMAGFYLLVAGMPVSAQRAYLMLALVMIAVLVDRRPDPLRLVAIAATIILLLTPESLLSASFQLSFAAVTGLIAFFSWYHRNMHYPYGDTPMTIGEKLRYRVMYYPMGIMAGSVVAILATAPFALYHFQQVNLYGVLANIAAMPLVTFWVMPMGLCAMLMLPFGLEAVPLKAMGIGINGLLQIAELVARLPDWIILAPPFPSLFLVMAALGGILWVAGQGFLRIMGAATTAAMFAFVFLTPTPVALVSDDHAMFRLTEKDWLYVGERPSRWPVDVWQRAMHMETVTTPETLISQGRARCDYEGCIVTYGTRELGYTRSLAALREDCLQLDLVLYHGPRPDEVIPCKADVIGVSERQLALSGAHAVFLEKDGFRIWRAARAQGKRPWSRRYFVR